MLVDCKDSLAGKTGTRGSTPLRRASSVGQKAKHSIGSNSPCMGRSRIPPKATNANFLTQFAALLSCIWLVLRSVRVVFPFFLSNLVEFLCWNEAYFFVRTERSNRASCARFDSQSIWATLFLVEFLIDFEEARKCLLHKPRALTRIKSC